MATEIRGNKLRNLINMQGAMSLESNLRFDEDDRGSVTWDEIWEAATSDGVIITDIQNINRMIVVDAARRGPVVSHDIDTLLAVVSESGVRNIRIPRIPHALLSHEMGYFTKGLPFAQQSEIIDQIRVTSSNGLVHLGQDGVSILNMDPKKSERVWTKPSQEVIVPDFKQFMGTALEITGVTDRVVNRLVDGLAQESSLQQGMVDFTNRTLVMLLDEAGYVANVESKPFDNTISVSMIDAYGVERKIREGISEASDVTNAKWYEHFSASIRKILRGIYSLPPEAAVSKWEKAVKNYPGAQKSLAFDTDTYKTQVESGDPIEQAFFNAILNTADLGDRLLDRTKEGIRLANGGVERFPYVVGKNVFMQMIDAAAQDAEVSVGFQPFTGRAETGLLLARLLKLVEQNGRPIPGIVVAGRATEKYDISIASVLKDL